MFLPQDKMTFDIDLEGNITHERYHGTFSVKCLLTNAETLQIAAAVDKMGGNSQTMPAPYRQFMKALCELDFLVLDAPAFWKNSEGGRTLKDQNVVNEVYAKALDQAVTYQKRINDEAEALSKAHAEHQKKEKEKANAAQAQA